MIDLLALARPCACEDCGADRWRPATIAETAALCATIGVPVPADGPVFFWTCRRCGNGAFVALAPF